MKKQLFTFLFFVCASFTVFGQTNDGAATTALKSKVAFFASEVYKNYPVYINATLLSVMEEHYDRVELKQIPFAANENYLPLSGTILINKYNPALVRDNAQNFNPATFNPLKYGLNFDAATDVTYRIDGTDYVVLIRKR